MSRYVRGIPRDIALCLKDNFNLKVFVETGTLIGYSSQWAAHHFRYVYTIEFFAEYYNAAVNKLLRYKNVICVKNESLCGLQDVLEALDSNFSVLFWLDAHWAKEAHYGRPKQDTNVLEEIKIINSEMRPAHAIIVDDAHKFSTPHWPNLDDVIFALSNHDRRDVRRVYDVIVASPREQT